MTLKKVNHHFGHAGTNLLCRNIAICGNCRTVAIVPQDVKNELMQLSYIAECCSNPSYFYYNVNIYEENEADPYYCKACGKPLLEGEDHFAEIRRGTFSVDKEGDLTCDDLKYNVFLCHDCYLTLPTFCTFMNSIGQRIR